jgi:hypothetical protein
VIAEGVSANATQIADAASRLNIIIKSCMSDGLALWTYQQYVIPCVVGQQVYTIGPVGANVTAVRPLRVMEGGNFIRQVIGTETFDTPLRLISRQEYMGFGNKTASGITNSIYYDSKFTSGAVTSPGTGFGSLYVYTTQFDATYTIYVNGQRPIYDMNSGTDEFDFPAEWFMYLLYALCAEMADDNEVDEVRIKRLETRADALREKLFDWSVETASTQFAPDYSTLMTRG